MRQNRILSISFISLLTMGTISAGIVLNNVKESYVTVEAYNPGTTYTNGDADTYYSNISSSLTGDSLLSALRSLNSSKRQNTVGYSGMGTSASGAFSYTDYDPSTVRYDKNNQPYGTAVLSFYSGNSCTSFNREHMWPKSHGGNLVEDDIHMPRPTIPAENGSRGNSFYVEGMCNGSKGWDPAMEDFGEETYRGDSARVIFYCVIADSKLSLIDETYHETSNNNRDNLMGKLSDMIKWHLKYPILQREMNRNEGAEYLQGNRNPFIDHPEYVCRIWGNTNNDTRALCANDPYENSKPTAITLSDSQITISVQETKTLTVASVNPADASKSVNWSSSNSSIATVDKNGVVKGIAVGNATITATSTSDNSVKATCSVTVTEPSNIDLTDVTLSASSQEVNVGKTLQLTTSTTPAFVYPSPTFAYTSSDSTLATVSSDGLVTGVKEGTVTIKVTATQGTTVKEDSIQLTVNDDGLSKYTLVTSASQLSNGDKVVVATDLENGKGLIGAGDNTGLVSANIDDWVEYQVVNRSSNTFGLYDSGKNKYIAEQNSNGFSYSTNSIASMFKTDSQGRLICFSNDNRHLQDNGSLIRFYTNSSNYPAFHIYKIASSTPVVTLDRITVANYTSEFSVGDTYSFDGVCTAYYSDNSSKQVTPTNIVSPDMTSAGTKSATIQYTEGGKTVQQTISITISGSTLQPIPVTSITLNKRSISLNVGGEETLVATVNPENADNKNVVWSSSDSSIATVVNGKVKALKAGNANIYVKSAENDNISAFCVVIIKNNADPTPDPTPTPSGGSSGGCGGSIVATSAILSALSLVGIGLIICKRKNK